jgi:hypothetical protein
MELHPDRDSPDYNGNKADVQNVKLDFLQSLTPAKDLSPQHPDDNDNRVDDGDDSEEDGPDPVIKKLFPFHSPFFGPVNFKAQEDDTVPLTIATVTSSRI